LQIIYEINRRFLEEVEKFFPNDLSKKEALSIIEESPERKVRMANLAVVGCHSTNGVSKLHSELVKKVLFPDFYAYFPKRFRNVTNGITPRRWLKLANPLLADLITASIGDRWIDHLEELAKLLPFAKDANFRARWAQIKRLNKQRLAQIIQITHEVDLNLDSLFDCQVKRIHEYKRQLLNALYLITLYNRIKQGKNKDFTPRTVIFGGKAAPGYYMAKMIIKLINSIAQVIDQDPQTKKLLRVLFMANYRVSLAEKIIPAADLSEQISTAGTEASGTGNMKFALNGALTIGTLDGANIEIKEQVGAENIFIFGHTAAEIHAMEKGGYSPYSYYESNPDLKNAIDMIQNGYFSPSDPTLFQPIVNSLLEHDSYFLLADYASYVACQEKVASAYRDQDAWTVKSIYNVANMGIFSSDRAVKQYADEIWHVKSPFEDKA